MLTPTTVTPGSCPCIASRLGSSSWHGAHHVAHRFSTTTLPRSFAKSSVSVPSVIVNCGAGRNSRSGWSPRSHPAKPTVPAHSTIAIRHTRRTKHLALALSYEAVAVPIDRTRKPVLGLLTEQEIADLHPPPPEPVSSRPASPVEDDLLELSVILPARDEEANLPACLHSLLSQSEPGFALGLQWELILVNDASTDRTREIAAQAVAQHPAMSSAQGPAHPAGVTLLDAPPLDPDPATSGFTGKNNACWAGAGIARGQHLLFTDADTLHNPGDLSRALREAEKHHSTLLSYSPRQITAGIAQFLVTPLIFSELASVYPPAEVNDPSRRIAAANGQFLLVERDAYFSVGGHRAIGKEVLEDVALARNIKRGGERNIRLRYAPDALSTRMYPTAAAMVEGWTKNLAVLMPSPISLALWRLLDLLLFFGLPALALSLPWLVLWQRGAILVLWLRTVLRFYSRVHRAHFPFVETATSILGIPLFVFLLLRSTLHHRVTKRVTWKGRTYPTSR